jgi:YfiH family protein
MMMIMSEKAFFITPNWPTLATVRAYSSLIPSQVCPPYSGSFIEAIGPRTPLIMQQLNCPNEPIWLNQTHGFTALEAISIHKGHEADASYSTQPNQVCAIGTADCLPILVSNHQGTEIAAIHAGWRGLSQNIIAKTLTRLQSSVDQLRVWIGPAISASYYPVKSDVYETFVQAHDYYALAFRQIDNAHWLADLTQLARIQLAHFGVTSVYGGEYCTYADSDKFYSYRRQGQQAGRNISLIWIETDICRME